METLYWLAVATVLIVLFFDYTNGFHDAANIVATIIASRAMTPAQAVVVVGVFEFLGPLLGGTAVANTIGKFVDLSTVDAHLAVLILFCGLLGRHRLESRDLVVRHSFVIVACAGRRVSPARWWRRSVPNT
jgi:PiT family inorganic phosphate transporter